MNDVFFSGLDALEELLAQFFVTAFVVAGCFGKVEPSF
jgi:hypothetical protein